MSKASKMGRVQAGVGTMNLRNPGAMRAPGPVWQKTPWWMLWRPYWRRARPGTWSRGEEGWDYMTKKQLARAILEREFGPKQDTAPQQGPATQALRH